MLWLRKLASRSWSEQWTLLEAVCLVAVARLAVLLLPFRWISRWVGPRCSQADDVFGEPADEVLNRVSWAVKAAGRRVPWRSECFEQALTACAMLRRRGGSGAVYFGVSKSGDGELAAHAWVRCGGTMVCGGRGHRTFTVVSTFAFGRQWSRSVERAQ